jgi:dTDP-4-amino-4,6-dideoxygalactose transaminase
MGGKEMRVNLSEMYMDDQIKKAVIEVLESGRFIKGEQLKKFEHEFAVFCSTKYAVGVSSGTAAILLSLMALGIGKEDEVIVPSHTFIATATPILFLGAKPVFADIDAETYTIAPKGIEECLNDRTKAIMPVHLYGHPADMDQINNIAQDKGLYVIEDACQAHGAIYKGKMTGSLADIACFSFYPSKNMTVCGDGGMVMTNNEELAEKVSMLRDHGRKEKYIHEMVGLNLRMSEISAAIGRQQLQHLSVWNEKRRHVAKLYNQLLSEIDKIATPVEKDWARHVYYMYVIRTNQRDKLAEYLKGNGISTGIHYPVPVHQQPIMEAYSKSLPVTEKVVDEILSLPTYPQLMDTQIKFITDTIETFMR